MSNNILNMKLAIAIDALARRGYRPVSSAEFASRILTEMRHPTEQGNHLRITITLPDGSTAQEFTVLVEGGWPLFKVAEEIRHNTENAYRVETDDLPLTKWRVPGKA